MKTVNEKVSAERWSEGSLREHAETIARLEAELVAGFAEAILRWKRDIVEARDFRKEAADAEAKSQSL